MNKKFLALAVPFAMLLGCNPGTESKESTTTTSSTEVMAGQSGVKDDDSQKNVVQVAVGLVETLKSAGPFTVFAPTNAAFDKLPKGTLENLLKPENKDALIDILQYHVSLGVYKADALQDGQVLGQVNGGNVTVSKKDGKIMIGGATIIASVPAANGIVHVVDAVMLPPTQ